MFLPSFCFYKGYIIPRCNTQAAYLEYIDSLPPTDSPQVYGLHPSADIAYVYLIVLVSVTRISLV